MADTLSAFALKLDRVADSITGRTLKKTLDKVGAEGKRNVNAAVASTLGDRSMSNWRRGRPIQIAGRYDIKTDSVIEILPARRAAGPMRVLEEGRKPGVSRKGRAYSGTSGKGTWTNATETMQKTLPRVAAAAVHDELGKIFGR